MPPPPQEAPIQRIVLEEPYEFVPPVRGTFWANLLGRFLLRGNLRSAHGLESVEWIGLERLRASLAAGDGILLAPNHCRPCDPMVVFGLGYQVGAPPHVMASWHLFMASALQRWILRRVGAFSIYREGMDREALKCAIGILAEARRPLALFPEGMVSRSNDRLHHLMEGTAFIARNAAKQRAARTPPGRVVVHPVAIRYFFLGDVDAAVEPVLAEIERRLSWGPSPGRSQRDRIVRAGEALLALKEMEYGLAPGAGEIAARVARLVDHILVPMEREWLKGRAESDIAGRVKALRGALLPDMIADRVDDAERARRWRLLADIYLAQHLALYPADYLPQVPSPEALLETVERFEEGLTDVARIHRPLHAAVEVGEAIEVPAGRDRGAEEDPIMVRVRGDLERLLEGLRARRPSGGTR